MPSIVLTCSVFATTIGLAVSRPRITRRWRVEPSHAAAGGVLVLFATGVVQAADVRSVLGELWRPFATIVSIMVSTAAADRLGLFERLGALMFGRPDILAGRLFLMVFALTAACSTLLNNDAAVLLLTPLVLGLVRRRFPGDDRVQTAFAFAIFTAVGVAPFVISNPINMIVASYASLDFNEYAMRMAPIAAIGWVISFLILRRIFSRDLAAAATTERFARSEGDQGLSAVQKAMLGLLVAVVGCYPIVASVDGSAIWIVSVAGAALAVMLACTAGRLGPAELLVRGVSWDVLAFLASIFVLSIGLRNVGIVDALSSLYTGAGVAGVGITAALGSAMMNNHPMAIINVLALESAPGTGRDEVLAALVGGDLGPRLLPIGSLAGLLWLEACRRQAVEIPLRQFVRIGFLVTVPALAVSLLLLRVS